MHRGQILAVGAGEAAVKAREQIELLARPQLGMIGDVVGGANEIVERQDHFAMTRMNEPGGDREILIPVSLAGPQFIGVLHRNSETLAWARPFHMPPRPRA